MDNENLLLSVQDADLAKSERAIFDVLQATLCFPASTPVKAAKLADDFVFFCRSKGDNEPSAAATILWDAWSVLIDVAACLPPGHPWQACLVQAINTLAERDDTLLGTSRGPPWKDLPDLSSCLRERWDDPTATVGAPAEELKSWRNLNSFAARLASSGATALLLHLAVWQLRRALEEPAVEGPTMACRVWVAADWISECAALIYQHLASAPGEQQRVDEATARALRTGPLCPDDTPPLSHARWSFWRKRFHELAEEAGSLNFGADLSAHIMDAVETMDTAAEHAV
ncbi:hypothetical protein NW767_015218 [Fusarium falciforme]|nr:hypothetical protein NW767_015218 [Fusarium falciforme]